MNVNLATLVMSTRMIEAYITYMLFRFSVLHAVMFQYPNFLCCGYENSAIEKLSAKSVQVHSFDMMDYNYADRN